MLIVDAEEEFRSLAQTRGVSLSSASPREVFAVVFEFWDQFRAQDAQALDENGDGLLFQWGIRPTAPDFWESCFYLDLTRQFILDAGEDGDAFSQLRCEFQYQPMPELRAVAEGNRWCWQPQDLAAFMDFVFSHPALSAVEGRTQTNLAVSLERV